MTAQRSRSSDMGFVPPWAAGAAASTGGTGGSVPESSSGDPASTARSRATVHASAGHRVAATALTRPWRRANLSLTELGVRRNSQTGSSTRNQARPDEQGLPSPVGPDPSPRPRAAPRARHDRRRAGGQLRARAPTMSGHFAVLKEAGLIQADRTGSTITYRLNVSVLEEAMMALMDAFRLEPRRSPSMNLRPFAIVAVVAVAIMLGMAPGPGSRSPPAPRSRSTGPSTAHRTATPRRSFALLFLPALRAGLGALLYFLPALRAPAQNLARSGSGLRPGLRRACSS